MWLLAKWGGGGSEDEYVSDANLMKSVESPSVALAVVQLQERRIKNEENEEVDTKEGRW